MSDPQSISGKPIWLGFHPVRGGVDTGGRRYCSRVFGAVEIRGIYESGMGPYLPRVRRKCPPLMGLYPPGTALWSSNQSAISQRDWSFLTVRGGVDPRTLGFLPRLVKVLEIWNDFWTGHGTLPFRGGAGSKYELQPIRVQPVGLGFPHRAGRYQPGRYPCSSSGCRSCRCVDGFRFRHVILSCPGDAYFVYESRSKDDQTKITCFCFCLEKKLEPDILTAKIVSAVVAYCIYKK